MHRKVMIIGVAAILCCLSGCEDEPVEGMGVSFEPAVVYLSGAQEAAALRPSFNVSSDTLVEAKYEVVFVLGFFADLDLDGDDEADFEIPEPESVGFSMIDGNFLNARASFNFQGRYTIQCTVTDINGRTGTGSIIVQIGDGVNLDASILPPGPITGGDS